MYVFELVHDEQTSLGIVQETFIAAVRHLGSLRDDDRFGSWLFGIAHQKCIQHWRKSGREEPWDEPSGGAEACAQVLQLRALDELQDGQSDKALEDLISGIKLLTGVRM